MPEDLVAALRAPAVPGLLKASAITLVSVERCQNLVPMEDPGGQVKVCRVQVLGTEVTKAIDYMGFYTQSIYVFICSFTW